MRFSSKVAALVAGMALCGAGGAPAATPRFGSWGVDPAGFDRAVKPGNDFWAYANGTWDRMTQIAPDRSSAGVTVALSDQAEIDVRQIVEQLADDPQARGVDRKIGDYYAAFMDEPGIQARGLAPLKPWLARIDGVTDRAGLLRLFAAQGYAAPIEVGIDADFADPTRYSAIAGQGSLGLPDRDYYLLPGAKYDAFRAAYRAYVQQIQTLAGFPDAAARTDRIMALETMLAKEWWARARRRDMKAIYNPMDRRQLTALAPQFDWPTLLAEQGLAKLPSVIVMEPSAIQAAGKALDSVPLATWKEYLAFRFVSDHAAYLPKPFDDARFAFYSKTLNDVPEQRARWKRGVQQVDAALGEAVGRIYVARHYPPESEQQMAELIENLRAAYADNIRAAKWMDEATRAQALAKLAAFDPRIGHPIRYIDYSSLPVSRTDPLANDIASDTFEWALQLSRLGKPVDRTLWDMTPQTVNAYYSPLMNQITFPAAILQPPFFDPAADPAVNYGAIGAVIGHEMGHGFDDQGRQFDATGKFRDWWTPATSAKYQGNVARLGAQYDRYEPVPGVHINGKLTMGENLGDLGGIEAAYRAYHRYLAQHGPAKVIDGLTGDQRFFIAYAVAWRGKRREGALRQQLLTDPHSPDKNRTDGIVRNVDAWYKAFDVKPGDALYLPPDQRVHVW